MKLRQLTILGSILSLSNAQSADEVDYSKLPSVTTSTSINRSPPRGEGLQDDTIIMYPNLSKDGRYNGTLTLERNGKSTIVNSYDGLLSEEEAAALLPH